MIFMGVVIDQNAFVTVMTSLLRNGGKEGCITHQVIRLFIVYDMSMKRHMQVYSPFHIHAGGGYGKGVK